MKKMDDLISEMSKLDSDFKDTGVYTRELVRSACAILSLPDGKYQNELIKLSLKVKHGLYRYSNSTDRPEVPEVEPSDKIESLGQVALMNDVAIVPKPEADYVAFGNYKNIEKVLSSRKFFPIYVTGPTGNGKSSMLIDICAKNKIPMLRINCSVQSDEEKMIGSKTLVNGNISVIYGPLLIAMKQGALVCLEEVDALDTRLALVLQGICEGRPYFFPLTNEYIYPANGFNIVGIGNTKGLGSEDGKYLGTNIQNTAFLERFGCTFEQKYPSPTEEIKMVKNWMKRYDCYNENIAEVLVKWVDSVRKTYDEGGIEEVISTRRLSHIITAYSVYGDIKLAVELCTARFDASTSTALRSLFDKMYVSDSAVV